MTENPKKITRSLIFVKSTTIALGIVLVVLLMVLLITSQKKPAKEPAKCQDFLEVNLSGEVQKMEINDNQIIILTKPNQEKRTQEIIKLNSKCTKIINKIKLNY